MTSAFLNRTSLVAAIVVSFVALVWLVTVAHPLVVSLVTIGVAVSWCIWLERHPDEAGTGSDNPAAHITNVVKTSSES